MTPRYQRPRLLKSTDAVAEFDCQSAEQTAWLIHHSLQANAAGTAKVFVVTPRESDRVVAYYAWAMASVIVEDLPARLRKGSARYPQPIALLARLGVDREHEGNGIGAGLLTDVIRRTATLGAEIGCRGLLVHAESSDARDFYMHLVPEFVSSPTDDLHLVLLMKDIAKTLAV